MLPILVTGAAGFVGYQFVERCRHDGIPVISVDEPAHFDTRPEHAGADFGTMVGRDALFDWLAATEPALGGIVHLGACTDTTETDEQFLARVNVAYSQRLWTFATAHGVPFVYASSAATYGDGANGYDDDESRLPRLVPLNAYGRSKLAFDLWALAQERAGAAPPAWSGWKFFNVYGYGERHKGRMASVVLHAYDQARAGGPVRLFRSHRVDVPDGHQSRDFVDVRDVVSVLSHALVARVPRGIRNLGSGVSRTYLDLACGVCRALGVGETVAFIDTPPEIRSRYQYFTQANVRRLREETGYVAPFASLERGIAAYVEQLRERAAYSMIP